jgi:hypothetical protein
VNETSECRPNHVHARPHIPRLQMPRQGNDRNEKPDPRKDRVHGVGSGHVEGVFLETVRKERYEVFKIVLCTRRRPLGGRGRDGCPDTRAEGGRGKTDNGSTRREMHLDIKEAFIATLTHLAQPCHRLRRLSFTTIQFVEREDDLFHLSIFGRCFLPKEETDHAGGPGSARLYSQIGSHFPNSKRGR